MNIPRRHFIQTSAAIAAGFGGLNLLTQRKLYAIGNRASSRGYGPLQSDPDRILDLPAGFGYKIISRRGDEMDDGLLVPDLPDGMATFSGPGGLSILVRNHELKPIQRGPFGKANKLLKKVPAKKFYDYGKGRTPGLGGTTTLVFDTNEQKVVRQFLSLAGTYRNCAGGPTPWKSWLTCEESVDRVGTNVKDNYISEKDHGYTFEVPASTKMRLADPVPLKQMGRFNHEAVAVDPRTSIVYLTEDRHEGLFYRFIPKKPRQLVAGGKLQVLALVDQKSADTRNWNSDAKQFNAGDTHKIRWLDIDNVESPDDDLRLRGHEAGAACFARGEGIWFGDNEIYFACTNGGVKKAGQIWRYRPSPNEGTNDEAAAPATLELFIEPNDTELLKAADNLTIAPWGDVILCEDRTDEVVRLLGVTPNGQLYTLANNHVNTEFAGATFSPDGSTLFVNLQGKGLTLAITGPWKDNRSTATSS